MAFNILDINENDNSPIENPRFYLQTAKYAGWISFILGTLLLLIYLGSLEREIIIIGLLYTLTAIVVNTIILLILLWGVYTQKSNRKIIAKRIGLFLLNIPISIAYFFIVIYVTDNISKVTITNDTAEDVNSVQLFIFENEVIDFAKSLKRGASKTRYIVKKSGQERSTNNEIVYLNANNEIIKLDIWGLSFGSNRNYTLNDLINNQEEFIDSIDPVFVEPPE